MRRLMKQDIKTAIEMTSFGGWDKALIALLAILALALGAYSLREKPDGGQQYTSAVGPPDFSRVVEEVLPSTVKVENEVMTTHPPIMGMDAPGEIPGTRDGAGFFLDKDGDIVTNFHVVDGAEDLRVVTYDKKVYEAELVGADALSDIAVIKIKPGFKVRPAILGDSDRLKAGQWVLAMGNPLGLDFFVSAGIVSGFGPPGPGYVGYYDFIQADLNIKPGNSGGPMLDAGGRVVGVNSAYLGPGTGIGFAIPVNRVKAVAEMLKRDGKVSRGFLGVDVQPLTAGLAERLGLRELKGALISEVMPDSPAYNAGIRPRDVVVEFDGTPVEDDRDLIARVYDTQADKTVTLKLSRAGKGLSVQVALGEAGARGIISERVTRQCGITLQEVGPGVSGSGGLHISGLLVLKVVPGCPAYDGGLRFGDIIRKVEGAEVKTVSDFYRAYSLVGKGRQVLITVIREGRTRFITIRQVAGVG